MLLRKKTPPLAEFYTWRVSRIFTNSHQINVPAEPVVNVLKIRPSRGHISLSEIACCLLVKQVGVSPHLFPDHN